MINPLSDRRFEPIEDENLCPICDEYELVQNNESEVELPCEHRFCKPCIEEAFQHQVDRKLPVDCPMCRAPQNTAFVHEILEAMPVAAEEEADVCAICYTHEIGDDTANEVELICGHIFCRPCTYDLFLRSIRACPLCRTEQSREFASRILREGAGVRGHDSVEIDVGEARRGHERRVEGMRDEAREEIRVEEERREREAHFRRIDRLTGGRAHCIEGPSLIATLFRAAIWPFVKLLEAIDYVATGVIGFTAAVLDCLDEELVFSIFIIGALITFYAAVFAVCLYIDIALASDSFVIVV